MNLSISQNAKIKVNDAILISGSARSGTTIMGQVVHSMKNVEYSFEPPVLFTLMPFIDSLKKDEWKLLYETYLYEEFFINAICGRSINCNTFDDSSIYKVKSSSDISSRISQSIRKYEAESIGKDRVIAYKMPSITPLFPKVIDYYPDTRLILMRRGAVATINSLLEKKWFSNVGLSNNASWPFLIKNNVNVPYWVCEEDVDLWLSMDEINRCAYYYVKASKMEGLDSAIVVQYEDLVSNPVGVITSLSDSLNLDFGPKTHEVISTIKPVKRELNFDVLHSVSPHLKEEISKLEPGLEFA